MGLKLDYQSYSLRDLKRDDAEMILQWRNSNQVRAYMYTDHVISRDEHYAWLNRVLDGSNSSYYIFELNGEPIGNIGFYKLSEHNKSGEWNFHLRPEGAPRGSGPAMEFLALDEYFLGMKMRKLNCEVIDFNEPVVRLHLRFGFEQEGLRRAHVWKNNRWCDIHELSMFANVWRAGRKKQFDNLFS